MTDTVLAALGLALRGGNLAVGEEPVAEACRTGKARVVLLASDAAGNTARRATRLAGENVPLVPLPRDKSQVGFALGRGQLRGGCGDRAGIGGAGFVQTGRRGESAVRPSGGAAGGAGAADP